MVQAKMTGNPAQVHPVHIQLDRFPAHCIWVSPGLGFGRVFDLAEHAAIALAAVRCFSSSVLAFRALTFWTSVHALILAQFLATPPQGCFRQIAKVPSFLLTRTHGKVKTYLTNFDPF